MITHHYTVKVPWDYVDLIILFITHRYTPLHARASYYTPSYKVCNKSPENHAYYTFITHCYTVKVPWGYVTLITLFFKRCYTLLHAYCV